MRVLFTVFFLTCAFASFSQTSDSRYFEMRTYHCYPGKRADLIKRFQDHTVMLFKRHNIENMAYFLPADTANNSLVFILGYPSAQSHDSLWNSFANDPDWVKAKTASEANGPLVEKVDQLFLRTLPFSPLK